MNLHFNHPHYYNRQIDEWIDDILEGEADERYLMNIRIAELTSQAEVAEYEEQKAKGCFEPFDKEYQHPVSGRRFKIGYNYEQIY